MATTAFKYNLRFVKLVVFFAVVEVCDVVGAANAPSPSACVAQSDTGCGRMYLLCFLMILTVVELIVDCSTQIVIVASETVFKTYFIYFYSV